MKKAYVKVQYSNYGGSHLANSNWYIKKQKAKICIRTNKVRSKDKIKIIESENIQDKTLDKVNSNSKASSESEVGFEP